MGTIDGSDAQPVKGPFVEKGFCPLGKVNYQLLHAEQELASAGVHAPTGETAF
jgi:hypothetical protein